jgi:tyrosyl-tRNA synthetase
MEEKIEKITRFLEEVITLEDLREFLEKKMPLKHYIGFELSGLAHLGTALFTSIKIKDFQECGIETNIFLADWHSWINNKLGGNLENIKEYGVKYFKEVFSITLKSIGAKDVNFILASQMYKEKENYWETVIEIAKHTTLSRVERSIDILGKKAGESVDFAKLIYPIMQVADIFVGGFNFVHAGIDQRKAHVIARQVADKLKISPLKFKNEIIKPVIVHQPLILSISKPPIWPIDKEKFLELKIDLKMSKSKPESCIFVHDSPNEIEEKIMKAFCPPKETFYNPILNIVNYIIFPIKKSFKVKNTSGTFSIFDDFNKLKVSYEKEEIHPLDLKESVLSYLIEILEPIYKHFASGAPQRLKEIILDLSRG